MNLQFSFYRLLKVLRLLFLLSRYRQFLYWKPCQIFSEYPYRKVTVVKIALPKKRVKANYDVGFVSVIFCDYLKALAYFLRFFGNAPPLVAIVPNYNLYIVYYILVISYKPTYHNSY